MENTQRKSRYARQNFPDLGHTPRFVTIDDGTEECMFTSAQLRRIKHKRGGQHYFRQNLRRKHAFVRRNAMWNIPAVAPSGFRTKTDKMKDENSPKTKMDLLMIKRAVLKRAERRLKRVRNSQDGG